MQFFLVRWKIQRRRAKREQAREKAREMFEGMADVCTIDARDVGDVEEVALGREVEEAFEDRVHSEHVYTGKVNAETAVCKRFDEQRSFALVSDWLDRSHCFRRYSCALSANAPTEN